MNAVDTNVREELKDLFRQLKGEEDGAKVAGLKRQFKTLLANVDAETLAYAEQELAREGFTLQDLRTACDVHLELMSDSLAVQDNNLPEDHPVTRFQLEHEKILEWMRALHCSIQTAQTRDSFEKTSDDRTAIKLYLDKLAEAESHSVRQESALFAMLERYSITEPPKVMWSEHKDMKGLRHAVDSGLQSLDASNWKVTLAEMEEIALAMAEFFAAHTRKETSVIYPISLKRFSDEDWREVREACDEIGYFDLTD